MSLHWNIYLYSEAAWLAGRPKQDVRFTLTRVFYLRMLCEYMGNVVMKINFIGTSILFSSLFVDLCERNKGLYYCREIEYKGQSYYSFACDARLRKA